MKKNIFTILKAEEKTSSSSSTKGRGSTVNTSSFTTRVSDGQSRRAVTITDGNYYCDLKFYRVEDIENTSPEERYKKALTSVKLRLGDNSPEWETLQEFFTTVFKRFKNSEPTFYSNKITYK